MGKIGYKRVKVSVTISVDEDVDKFFEACCHEVIDTRESPIKMQINTEDTKNSFYNRAIKYAIKNAGKWLFL